MSYTCCLHNAKLVAISFPQHSSSKVLVDELELLYEAVFFFTI